MKALDIEDGSNLFNDILIVLVKTFTMVCYTTYF